MNEPNNISAILKAIHFAADKHRNQRRQDVEATPYINHPIELAELLARVVNITDIVTLQAAILHDTVEDTKTSFAELDDHFGIEVREVVEEVTDDKKLPKEERKRLQIEHAPNISHRAKQVKIADKISNVLGVTNFPPADWELERREEYLDWTEKVVKGWRGNNPALEMEYDNVLQIGRQQLELLKRETIQEQQTLSEGSRYPRLTPEQIEMSRQRDGEISATVIETLHKDNQEIFGKDYDKKN